MDGDWPKVSFSLSFSNLITIIVTTITTTVTVTPIIILLFGVFFNLILTCYIALPSKPLTSIALEDADPASALSFVQDKLAQFNVNSTLNSEQKVQIGRLG